MRGFGSDNNSGVHPQVMAALAAANVDHVPGYGDDPYTAAAAEALAGRLGAGARVFFVFGGTGANVTGLAAALEPFQAVICPAQAHIYVDECGAVERLSGAKLLPVPAPLGKLTPEAAEPYLDVLGDVHASQPRVLSISQPTELGTVYTPAETRALADFAHERGLLLHMDGARLANAAAGLGLPLSALTGDCGVDILSFGGTKNGLMYGEAVVFFPGPHQDRLAGRFAFLRKQGTQLSSKMRFIAAQFSALLEGDLWLASARHANAMARRLAEGAARVPGFRVRYPVEANMVFIEAPAAVMDRLRERFFFYGAGGQARWVCSFDTTPAEVDAFLEAMRAA